MKRNYLAETLGLLQIQSLWHVRAGQRSICPLVCKLGNACMVTQAIHRVSESAQG